MGYAGVVTFHGTPGIPVLIAWLMNERQWPNDVIIGIQDVVRDVETYKAILFTALREKLTKWPIDGAFTISACRTNWMASVTLPA